MLTNTASKIGKASALTMSIAEITKSLLLASASIIIWATLITLLQSIGYAISLVGMFYFALPANFEPLYAVFTACLHRCANWSKGAQSQTWYRRASDPLREPGGYRVIHEDRHTNSEGSVLLDDTDERK
ncbi:hypothetical protein F5883DRAFT_65607 [Diaporthe sp. PMI_573]|jgi:hypothetical protein|nr:hypothetical protein F5883DRAFT_65607 [Diaporthaceae sp. PMI_573]